MVVDAHTHAWGPDTEEHPWTTEPIVEAVEALPIETEYTAEVLLEDMDEVGIDEAFVIGLPVTDWLDNWYVKRAAREHDRLYGIGLLDPFADDADDALRDLMAVDDVVGFRLATVYPRDGMYEVDPADSVQTDWLLDECGREQLAWGSDYQFISPETEYASTLTCLDRMDTLSRGDVEWLTGRSFKRHLDV